MLDKLSWLCLCNTFPWALWMGHEQHQSPLQQHSTPSSFSPSCDRIETGLTLYQHMVCALGNCCNSCISSSGVKISTAKAAAVAPSAAPHTQALPRQVRMEVEIKEKLFFPIIHLKFKYSYYCKMHNQGQKLTPILSSIARLTTAIPNPTKPSPSPLASWAAQQHACPRAQEQSFVSCPSRRGVLVWTAKGTGWHCLTRQNQSVCK